MPENPDRDALRRQDRRERVTGFFGKLPVLGIAVTAGLIFFAAMRYLGGLIPEASADLATLVVIAAGVVLIVKALPRDW